jgi:O-antigen ligase
MHSLLEFSNGRHVYRMKISRLVGVDLTYSDPNSLAAGILMALAFVPAVWHSARSNWARCLLSGYVAMSFLCIALTGSRSGFVGFAIFVVVVVWRSRLRAQLAPLAILAAPLVFLALPADLQLRFTTIIDPSVGPANAKESAEGRIQGFLTGMELWNKYPLTGIGPNAWIAATHRTVRAHNLLGQLAGEMGTLGLLTFISLVLAQVVNFVQIRKLYREHPEWARDFMYEFNNAVSLGVLLLLFEGNFGHNLFRYHWVWFAAFMVIARHLVTQRAQNDWRAGPSPAPGYRVHCLQLDPRQARLG